jgi:hypothetical protein
MATKKATVLNRTAFQKLVGWSGGKPAITKIEPPVNREPGATFDVDDGVITSSAVQPKQYYWVMGTEFYVKKDDVKLT